MKSWRSLFLIVGFLCFRTGAMPQDASDTLEELGAIKLDNCGASVSLFLLEWFEVRFDVEYLENKLELGPHWEKATSLERIKTTLTDRGLRVAAYKEARIDELLPLLDGKQLCLIHVRKNNLPQGHFFLIIAKSGTTVFVVDAGHSQKWIPIPQFKEQFEKEFTGYCMFVSRPMTDTNSPSAKTPQVDQVAHQ
jgi:hypothetical protein